MGRVVLRGLRSVLISALMTLSQTSFAETGSCQSYEAAYNLEVQMREGLSLEEAKKNIILDEYSDGSAACFRAIKNEITQAPYAFPTVHQVLYRRIRR